MGNIGRSFGVKTVPKPTRGGKRKGAGHPRKNKGVDRKPLSATVHPDTFKKIDAERKTLIGTNGKPMSRGEYIDYVMSAQ